MRSKVFLNSVVVAIFVCPVGFGQTINSDNSYIYTDTLSYSTSDAGVIVSAIFNYCINGTNNNGSQAAGSTYSISSSIHQTTGSTGCGASHLLLRFDTSSIASSTISSAKIRIQTNNWYAINECAGGSCTPYLAFYYFLTSPGTNQNWVTYFKVPLCSIQFSQLVLYGYTECSIPSNLLNQIKTNPFYVDVVVFLSLPSNSYTSYGGVALLSGSPTAQLVVTTGGGAKLIIISESS